MSDNVNNQKTDPREGEQIKGANDAANVSDVNQPSHWTAGKENLRSETDILRENAQNIDDVIEQLKRAKENETENFHGEQPIFAGFEGTEPVRSEMPEEFT